MSNIVVHNWKEVDTVNYRLIIVKGFITENDTINRSAFGVLKCRVNHLESTWKVHEGSFKCLVSLNTGVNRVHLSYENRVTTLEISLKHHETQLCIIPVYLVCSDHDGKFQSPDGCDNSIESACLRIGLGVQLIQCIFGEKLKENGFPKKSFQIENDLDSAAPLCRIFHSKLPVSDARSWEQKDLWEYFGRELMLSELGDDNKKYLAFLSCTLWDGNRVIGDPALAGGGLALVGTGCLHTWPRALDEVIPCFDNDIKVEPHLLDNSYYRGTYGGCYSTTLGSVCHELGHMFNLGHTETGIMSRGFDYTNLVFTIGHDQTYVKNNIDLVPILEVRSGDSIRGTSNVKQYTKNAHAEDDATHLTHACAAILAHHRWFNENKALGSCIEYDNVRSIVTSEVGLKVVQVRGVCGSVWKSWEVGTKAKCKQLVLPRIYQNKSVTLVAIDSNGDIYSKQI